MLHAVIITAAPPEIASDPSSRRFDDLRREVNMMVSFPFLPATCGLPARMSRGG
jgi:hypothetical protein